MRRGYPVTCRTRWAAGDRASTRPSSTTHAQARRLRPAFPRWLRFSDEGVWPNFRIGPKPGQPYPDTQFPVSALDELSKQGVPDVTFGGGVPNPNPTFKALADLAGQLNGAVLMGHSQSGSYPLAAALLNPGAMKGLVLVEPGTCPANYTAEQIATLAKMPILVVFGDYRDTPTGMPSPPNWQTRFEACQATDRPDQGGWRAGADAQPGRDRRPRQQPHDHAGQEPPAGRRSHPASGSASASASGAARRNDSRAATSSLRADAIAWAPCCWPCTRAALQRAAAPRLALELQDYAALPITADNTDANTRAQLARVNYLRDEPGGRRFFVNDLNGPLYILDKQTKTFTTYLDFNGSAAGRAVPEIHLRAQLRHRTHQLHFRSRLRAERRVLHAPHGRPVDTGPAPPEGGVVQDSICPVTRRRRRSRRRPSTDGSIARSC